MENSEASWQKVALRYHNTTRWLLSQQNRDGSWGKTAIEKVRWTSNVVISLSLLQEPLPNSSLAKAISFLNTEQVRTSSEWMLRIPALLPYYSSDQYEKDIGDLLAEIRGLEIFFRVGILLQIEDNRLDQARKEALSVVSCQCTEDKHGNARFSEKPNQNTMYCLFILRHCSEAKLRDTAARSMASTRAYGGQARGPSGIRFSDSNGISGYVGLNLLEYFCDGGSDDDLGYYMAIANGFTFKHHRHVLADLAGDEAFQSISAIYTSSIYLRYVSAVFRHFPDFGQRLFRFVITRETLRSHDSLSLLIGINWLAIGGLCIVLGYSWIDGADIKSTIVGTIPGVIVALASFIYTLTIDRRRLLG